MSIKIAMLNGCASEKTKQTAAQENDTEEDSGEKKIQIVFTQMPKDAFG